MFRPVVAIFAGMLTVAAVANLRDGPVGAAERAEFANACDYYHARAQAVPDERAGAFVGFLSEACVAAESLIATGTPEQRARSALLLSRIVLLRRTVADMNARRAAGAADRTDLATGYVPVNPFGEFLIAHRLGVLLAFDAWVDTGAQFSLASYP